MGLGFRVSGLGFSLSVGVVENGPNEDACRGKDRHVHRPAEKRVVCALCGKPKTRGDSESESVRARRTHANSLRPPKHPHPHTHTPTHTVLRTVATENNCVLCVCVCLCVVKAQCVYHRAKHATNTVRNDN